MRKKWISVILAVTLVFSFMLVNVEGYAGETTAETVADDAQYDTSIYVAATYISEVMTKIDAALQNYSSENRAGDVCIRLINGSGIYMIQNKDVLSIPTDKGIDSVTFVNGSRAAMVYVGYGENGRSFHLFANGIPLTVDQGVCIGYSFGGIRVPDVAVYGGSRNADVASTNITVNKGGMIMGTLYGGGLNGDVKGDVNIDIYGGCGNLYGGGFVCYEDGTLPAAADVRTANVEGAVRINVDNDGVQTQENPCGLVGSTHLTEYFDTPQQYYRGFYDSDFHGGGRIQVSGASHNTDEEYDFSAQVMQGVTINMNCQVSPAKIFGGGEIQHGEEPLQGKLNADVNGNVNMTLGERVKMADCYIGPIGYRRPYAYSFMIFGGGKAEHGAIEHAEMTLSAQIHGDVTIDAEKVAAAGENTNEKDACDSIFGGGYAAGKYADATVNGSTDVKTSKKAPAFKSKGTGYLSVGVAGGGYATSGGTANVTGNTKVHICKAAGQPDDYANVKNVFGGGVSTGGTANVGGNAKVIIDDGINFAGGYFEVGVGTDIVDEKTGVIGGGWAYYDNAHADVLGTASITVGKDACFQNDYCRIVGGGKVGIVDSRIGYVGATADVGDVNVTMNGTLDDTPDDSLDEPKNKLDELFLGSFEGRSSVGAVNVTLNDSFVGWIHDKDNSNEIVNLNLVGEKCRLFQANLFGKNEDTPKKNMVNIGDGINHTTVKVRDYFFRSNDPTVMHIHIYNHAALQPTDYQWYLFYGANDLTIDAGGVLNLYYGQSFDGDLSGAGTISMPAGNKNTVNGAFTGNITLDITGTPRAGDVVAMTPIASTTGTFIDANNIFGIKKVENGDYYAWTLCTLPTVTTAPRAKPQLIYNGEEQELIDEGSAAGGTIAYALNQEGPYSFEIPEGKDAGTYTVYCRIIGDAGYGDTELEPILVRIEKAAGEATVSMADYSVDAEAVEPVPVSATNGTENVTYQYKVSTADENTYTNVKPTVAGEYTVKAVFPETKNYHEAIAYATFKIHPASSAGGGDGNGHVHVHTFGPEWKSDELGHWQVCWCGIRRNRIAHTAGEWIVDKAATATADGSRHQACETCGYVMKTEVILATGETQEQEAAEKQALIKRIQKSRFVARSSWTTLHGKRAIKVRWFNPKDSGNVELKAYDGFVIFRSTKRYSGYKKEPIFVTKNKYYINNKKLRFGTRYYYKVRGYKMIDGKKYYSQWSLKAWRKIWYSWDYYR